MQLADPMAALKLIGGPEGHLNAYPALLAIVCIRLAAYSIQRYILDRGGR